MARVLPITAAFLLFAGAVLFGANFVILSAHAIQLGTIKDVLTMVGPILKGPYPRWQVMMVTGVGASVLLSLGLVVLRLGTGRIDRS